MSHLCVKRFEDIPFAHRQPRHSGHCRFIHGHNWTFEVTFSCSHLDECGFVMDFGDLKYLKEYIAANYDHAVVLNKDDHVAGRLGSEWAHVTLVPDCSCEGLAQWLCGEFDTMVRVRTAERVRVDEVTVWEDRKNCAIYSRTS